MSDTEGGLSALVGQRRRKLVRLSADGSPAYPNHHRPDTSVADFVLKYRHEPLAKPNPDAKAPPVTGSQAHAAAVHRLAGRVMAINNFGRAAFVRIQDDSTDQLLPNLYTPPLHGEPQQGEPQRGLLQLYIRQENLTDRGRLARAELDIGDIVFVAGTAMRTKTGELTLLVQEFDVLTKALRPLPEKWHGLSDVEIRYRQRYLDLIVNPEVRAMFRLRARVQAWLRSYLSDRGFLEVETPMMQSQPGGASAKPFVTRHQALGLDLYLRIAPELYLKRLVVGGLSRVFEINRNFRNEGISTSHNPEFTMLEFYQAHADVDDMAAHIEAILSGLAREVLQADTVVVGEHTIHLTAPFAKMTMREAIARHGGPAASELEDAKAVASAVAAAHLPACANMGQGIVALFEHHAERALIQPTIIHDFPREVSPLSRTRSDAPDVAERFELYVAGRELANAFSELNDPTEQRARFAAQGALRAAGDEEAHGIDEDYLVALEHGLPPTGGLGLGIDRLMMLLTGAQSIRDVVLFPQMRPER